MKKKYIWWVAAAVAVLVAVFWVTRNKKKAEAELIAEVVQSDFEVLVTVTGELQAKNSENIVGPDLRSGVFRFAEYKIQDLVAEGTVVDSGDYVAELDRSTSANALLDIEDRITEEESSYLTTRLDTTMTLQGLRDELLNKRFAVEEAEIKMEQSKFEPPATIRQAEIDVDKAKRSLEQAYTNYELRSQQAKANMEEAEIDLARQVRRRQQMLELLEQFTIHAPKKGMVIYFRERNGQKRKIGSVVDPWNPIVATLPDLSVMISRTYVNEIDISKVKQNQQVRVGVDAFPDKKYTGKVISVADIGEQLANADAKVFEVVIEVNESDPIMRPSMTTSNAIIINTLYDVKHLPIDAIYSQDSIPFVYKTNRTKQVVSLGESNENEVVIEQGLEAGDQVFLSVPDEAENWSLAGEELIPVIKEQILEKKKAKEEMEHKAEEESKARRQREGYGRPGGNPGNGNMPRNRSQDRPQEQ